MRPRVLKNQDVPLAPLIAPIRQAAEIGDGKVVTGLTDCGCGSDWEPGVVLDPFCGSGTALVVAVKLGRRYLGFELNPDYVRMAEKRLDTVQTSAP